MCHGPPEQVRRYRVGLGGYFFAAPSTWTLKLFATENRTFLRAGIFTGSPVCGLRPMRALLCTFRNVPRSGILTGSPFFTEPTTVVTNPSISACACDFVIYPHLSSVECMADSGRKIGL